MTKRPLDYIAIIFEKTYKCLYFCFGHFYVYSKMLISFFYFHTSFIAT